tara:strand:+ start:235 stop:702 length:468 start_codon:yes stop_codon:yes gene_type:complete
MPKETKLLLFNKKTGVLLGDIPSDQPLDVVNLEKFVTKEVSIDPISEYWDGDYNTGTVKTVDVTTRFTETAVNSETTADIEEKYDIVAQLNILRNAIEAIGGDKLPKEFTDMCEYIKDCVEKGKLKKKTYQENDAFDYMSKEDLAIRTKQAIDLD